MPLAPPSASARGVSPLPHSGRKSVDGTRADRQLLDDYTLHEELGQGAYGVVYACARRGQKDDQRAVKMIDKVESPVAEIKREAEILDKINHVNIIKFHEVYYEKCFVCIVMDRYKGGDLIAGMQHHWENKGRIPCAEVKHVKRQCAVALEVLHSKGIIHRDVKGDNYLLDRIDIRDPMCKVVLSDFGTAMKCKIAERCNGAVGTKTYWSPEFYNNDYGQKVDVWAFGVIVYGLLESRFPFKDEEAARVRKPKLHPDLPTPCVDFVRSLLKKEENRRSSAAEAVNHPWIKVDQLAPPAEHVEERVTPTNAHANEGNEKDHKIVQESQPAAKDRERRYELVERLENAKKKQAGDSVSHHFMNDSWDVYYRHEKKTVTFSWMADKRVSAEIISDTVGSEVAGNQATEGVAATEGMSLYDRKTIEDTLKDHGIDISAFGKGTAKSIDEFIGEIRSGEAQLMLDAAEYKKMVRVVDVVLIRIAYRNASGEKKYLIEVGDKLNDGRVRNDLNRLPGTKKDPHENLKKVTSRILKDLLGLEDGKILVDFKTKEVFEEDGDSLSYPGVRTVYRKEIVEAQVNATDISTLMRIGCEGKTNDYSFEDKTGYVKYMKWFTEAQCKEMTPHPVMLRAPKGSQMAISGLVAAPILITESALANYLSQNGIDVSKFTSQGEVKSLAEFASELTNSESGLARDTDGKIVRVVDVIVLRLHKEGTDKVLVMDKARFDSGSTKALMRLPGTKKFFSESQFQAAYRVLERTLQIDENCVNLNTDKVRVVEEKKDSASYPGMQTLYRKRIIMGEVGKPHETDTPKAEA
eukprot:TRINITY_DN27798_c0_g7_i1.p1 TRINITY_DN27798_c0_g7~~TRINITY_DN27798_c0_g7_i1.p1  ORF type:complete len:834 (+),score=254.93 TRINITY_DN27798_c0_g7_i1:75-2504(+)